MQAYVEHCLAPGSHWLAAGCHWQQQLNERRMHGNSSSDRVIPLMLRKTALMLDPGYD